MPRATQIFHDISLTQDSSRSFFRDAEEGAKKNVQIQKENTIFNKRRNWMQRPEGIVTLMHDCGMHDLKQF